MSAPEIATLRSRVVYSNRWMRLDEDEIARGDGSTGIYAVVRKPPFALVVPADATGFHLVEQYRYPARGRYLEFPQGGWEGRFDVDPAELAAGELAEETGLRAGSLRRLGPVRPAQGYSDQEGHVFLATDLSSGPTKLDPEEVDLVTVHVRYEEFPALVAAGRIVDGPSLAAYALLLLDCGVVARAG